MTNDTNIYTTTLLFDEAINNYINEVPVSFTLGNHVAGDISASVKCKVTDEAKKLWKIETFKAIIDRYEEELEKYHQKLDDEKEKAVVIKETNPGFYR